MKNVCFDTICNSTHDTKKLQIFCACGIIDKSAVIKDSFLIVNRLEAAWIV